MPFQSSAQQKYMFANHPAIAKRWANETPNMKSLPKHKKSAQHIEMHRKALLGAMKG